MLFNTLNAESLRQLINVQQRTDALRAIQGELRHRFAGTMRWKPRQGRDYLYRRRRDVETSLGVRSPETEAIHDAFRQAKALAEERETGLRQSLEDMRAANRMLGLGRVPRPVARILRRLDRSTLLGEQVCVVGTNALYAYEAHAGVVFERDLLATDDVDLALDTRRRLTLAARTLPAGLLGLLKDADRSFEMINENDYRAASRSGLQVDLITPEPKHQMRASKRRRLTEGVRDIEAIEVPRLEMIVDAPRFTRTAIDEDGLPVWMAVADPRWWCAHKLWLSEEPSRNGAKRRRDHAQAHAVATMLAHHWTDLDLSDEALAAIPAVLRRQLREAVQAAELPPAEW